MIITKEIIDKIRNGTFLGIFSVKRCNMDNVLLRNYILNLK